MLMNCAENAKYFGLVAFVSRMYMLSYSVSVCVVTCSACGDPSSVFSTRLRSRNFLLR
jgi:hypothetical protein